MAPGATLTSGAATLTINNTLTIEDNAILTFRLSPSPTTDGVNDLVSVTGGNTVTIGNGGTLNINAYAGPLALGNYVLISTDPAGSINGGAVPTGWTFNATGDSRHTYTLVEPDANHLDLNVTPPPNDSILTLPATALTLNMRVNASGTPGSTTVSNGSSTDAGHFTASSGTGDALTFSPSGSTLVAPSGSTPLNFGWSSTGTAGSAQRSDHDRQ